MFIIYHVHHWNLLALNIVLFYIILHFQNMSLGVGGWVSALYSLLQFNSALWVTSVTERTCSCVWRAVSSDSSHHTQKVPVAQVSLNNHKGGLRPHSFILYSLSDYFITKVYIFHIYLIWIMFCICEFTVSALNTNETKQTKKVKVFCSIWNLSCIISPQPCVNSIRRRPWTYEQNMLLQCRSERLSSVKPTLIFSTVGHRWCGLVDE